MEKPMSPIFAIIKDPDAISPYASIWDSADAWHEATFSPETKCLFAMRLTPSGKTYTERKAGAFFIAQNIQNAMSDYEPTESWWLEAELGAIFERLGKRYGLLTEFRENGIR